MHLLNKILNLIKTDFWKVFSQVVLNTFYLFFILLTQSSKLLFLAFIIALVIQVIGIILLCAKGALINVTTNQTTNNKFICMSDQDIEQLKKNNPEKESESVKTSQ